MTSPSTKQHFFFIHIMKTGGTSLTRAMNPSFSHEERYPGSLEQDHSVKAKADVDLLRDLPQERLNQIRSFSVHMPFFASEFVDSDVLTLTMLRDPVNRVISHLKQIKRNHKLFATHSLDEIYAIPWLFHSYFNNHQTKAFSMFADDLVHLYDTDEQRACLARRSGDSWYFSEPHGQMLQATLYAFGWDVPVNEERLAIAKANLNRVNILGFLERYDDLLATLERDYGLRIQRLPPTRTGHQEAVSTELLARIEQDNQYDIEFYRYAQELYAERFHHSD